MGQVEHILTQRGPECMFRVIRKSKPDGIHGEAEEGYDRWEDADWEVGEEEGEEEVEEEGEEEEVVCTECDDGNQEEGNMILLCDGKGIDGTGCDTAYHQRCVGVFDGIPEGDWFCPSCLRA